MTKHTSSSERMMLTTITELIEQAKGCDMLRPKATESVTCPLMHKLMEVKKSLQTEVRQKGENNRDQRP